MVRGEIASAEAKPLYKHADTVCRSHQLNREKGVERVEDPSAGAGQSPAGVQRQSLWVVHSFNIASICQKTSFGIPFSSSSPLCVPFIL